LPGLQCIVQEKSAEMVVLAIDDLSQMRARSHKTVMVDNAKRP
jgi:hypothetical protein